MRIDRYFGLIAGAIASSLAQAQSFDNAGVIALHEAGLGDAAIVAKINSMPCGYDASTAGLIALKRAGLSDVIIAAMVNRCAGSSRAQGEGAAASDPLAPHAPGIYVLQEGQAPTLQTLRPSKPSGLKVSGNGSILWPYVTTLVLPEPHSHNLVNKAQPTFYFYFNAADKRVSDFGSATSGAAQSPDEFTLVRFHVKGEQRDIVWGKRSIYTGSRGIDTKASVGFVTQEIGDGIFKVSFGEKLAAGEYGFVFTGANGGGRVYDFSIS
jgi:hypothetical protein